MDEGNNDDNVLLGMMIMMAMLMIRIKRMVLLLMMMIERNKICDQIEHICKLWVHRVVKCKNAAFVSLKGFDGLKKKLIITSAGKDS